MTPPTDGEAPAALELRERLGALGWGMLPQRDGYILFRVASSRTCKSLDDVRQLVLSLECHSRATDRKGHA